MNKKQIVILTTVLSALIFTNVIEAQVKNSIYSIFGIGEVGDDGFGVNQSLGGTGIAFQRLPGNL